MFTSFQVCQIHSFRLKIKRLLNISPSNNAQINDCIFNVFHFSLHFFVAWFNRNDEKFMIKHSFSIASFLKDLGKVVIATFRFVSFSIRSSNEEKNRIQKIEYNIFQLQINSKVIVEDNKRWKMFERKKMLVVWMIDFSNMFQRINMKCFFEEPILNITRKLYCI